MLQKKMRGEMMYYQLVLSIFGLSVISDYILFLAYIYVQKFTIKMNGRAVIVHGGLCMFKGPLNLDLKLLIACLIQTELYKPQRY